MLLWLGVAVMSATVMAVASRIALRHSVALGERLSVPPLLVGVTIVALGSDLPEIVNSIVSSYFGHGDINVGDSIGSVFAQSTLILGLVPFVAKGPIRPKGHEASLLSGLTAVLLAIGATVVRDGALTRVDAVALMLAWLCAAALAFRLLAVDPESKRPVEVGESAVRHAGVALLSLAAVGAAASGLVHAVATISSDMHVPELVVSFFGAALATSLPELVVNLTAMRRGLREIALGGILGACLMDASLSMASGPLLFPTSVTADLALRAILLAGAAMLLVGLGLFVRGKHDRVTGAAFISLYVAGYFLVHDGRAGTDRPLGKHDRSVSEWCVDVWHRRHVEAVTIAISSRPTSPRPSPWGCVP
jgi:cation:H+ antiporter